MYNPYYHYYSLTTEDVVVNTLTGLARAWPQKNCCFIFPSPGTDITILIIRSLMSITL